MRLAKVIPEAYRRRLQWLAAHTRIESASLEILRSADEVRSRLINATRLPPGRMSTPQLRQAHRNEAFVTGGFLDDGLNFYFTGYREHQWMQAVIDPDAILKPRLKGTIAAADSSTIVTYRVDAHVQSKLFFFLVVLATSFVLLAAALTLVYRFVIPGPAFFSLLLAGVCLIFANGIWGVVTKAQDDEAFLEDWLERVLDQP